MECEADGPGAGSKMERGSAFNPWLDILNLQLAMGQSAIDALSSIIDVHPSSEPSRSVEGLEWTTEYRVLRELPTSRLLDFSVGCENPDGAAVLIVAPYALHGGSVADFAPGHSVVETLLREGVTRLYLTDWRSATPERRFDSIDTHLAELNVAIDDICRGAPVALVGLCQGGWLAAAFAARFPWKVRALALVGAPIDITAEASALSGIANATPTAVIDELLRRGEGLLLGRLLLPAWPLAQATSSEIRELLQSDDAAASGDDEALMRRFGQWNQAVRDLPGVFYRQVVDWIFRENRLAHNRLQALGETIELERLTCPLFLLAGRDDEVVSPGQLTAIANLVGTPPGAIETRIVAGRHLSLFMGRATLAREWPRLARFLMGAYRGEKPSQIPADRGDTSTP